jgi:hypothetical protein
VTAAAVVVAAPVTLISELVAEAPMEPPMVVPAPPVIARVDPMTNCASVAAL